MRRYIIVLLLLAAVFLISSKAAAFSTTLEVTLVNQNTEPYGMHLVVEGGGESESTEHKSAYAEPGHTAHVTFYNTAYFQTEKMYGYTATVYLDGQTDPLGSVVFRVYNIYSIYPQVNRCEIVDQTGHITARATYSPVIRYMATVTIYAPR